MRSSAVLRAPSVVLGPGPDSVRFTVSTASGVSSARIGTVKEAVVRPARNVTVPVEAV
jgi:hypothetical protein